MLLDDIRKTLEATFSNLSPSKAQELAKGLMEPGAAKDQIAKTAAELDSVSGGLENTLISNLKLMARRNGQTASDGTSNTIVSAMYDLKQSKAV